MGAWPSTPPPNIDLLPPRIEGADGGLAVGCQGRRGVARLSQSPLDTGFGHDRLQRLFTANFAEQGAVSVRGALVPNSGGGSDVASVEFVARVAPLRPSATRGDDAATVTLAFADEFPRAGGGAAVLVDARAHLSTGGRAAAQVGAYDAESGLGVYALAHADARPGVGRGVAGGGAARYASPPPPAAAAPAPAAAPPAPSPAPAFGGGGLEVGGRYESRGGGWSVGVHASPFPPHPTKVWAVGRYGSGGAVRAGLQVAGDASGVAAPWRATAPTPPPLPQHDADGGAPPASPRRLDVDAALSVSRAPHFAVSLALDAAAREVAASFVHSATVRRAVYNPLEAAHVVGIWNYVDVGVEFRRGVAPPFASALALGAAWQVNKNVLVKGRLGSRDAAATAALRLWWDPALTLAATVAVDRATGAAGGGLLLGVDRGGAPEYAKAAEGAQGAAPSLPLRAQPQLAARRAARVDEEPFAPPRRGTAGGGADPLSRARDH